LIMWHCHFSVWISYSNYCCISHQCWAKVCDVKQAWRVMYISYYHQSADWWCKNVLFSLNV
jgi:hypothetical protein